jgi:hypothetical protein
MPVSITNLIKATSTVAATSFTTASFTVAANALIIVTVQARPDTGNALCTATSTIGWLTPTLLAQPIYDPSTTGDAISVFRCMSGTGGTGTITFDFTGQNELEALWSVDQAINVDTSGSQGSGAVVQVVTNTGTGTSLSVTLAAGAAGNASFGAFGNTSNASTFTVGSGYTVLGQVVGNQYSNMLTEWRSDFQMNVTATQSLSSIWGGIGIEILAAPIGAPMLGQIVC